MWDALVIPDLLKPETVDHSNAFHCHHERVETRKMTAAPAVPRTANVHRAHESLSRARMDGLTTA